MWRVCSVCMCQFILWYVLLGLCIIIILHYTPTDHTKYRLDSNTWTASDAQYILWRPYNIILLDTQLYIYSIILYVQYNILIRVIYVYNILADSLRERANFRSRRTHCMCEQLRQREFRSFQLGRLRLYYYVCKRHRGTYNNTYTYIYVYAHEGPEVRNYIPPPRLHFRSGASVWYYIILYIHSRSVLL